MAQLRAFQLRIAFHEIGTIELVPETTDLRVTEESRVPGDAQLPPQSCGQAGLAESCPSRHPNQSGTNNLERQMLTTPASHCG